MNGKYFVVIGEAFFAPPYHSKFIFNRRCYYGFCNARSTAEDYIEQFQYSSQMGYVKVSKELMDTIGKKTQLGLIEEQEIQWEEDAEPDCRLACTEDELFTYYESTGSCEMYDNEALFSDMNRALKGYESKTAKDLRKLLRKFVKEISTEGQKDIRRNKKYHILRMIREGLR